LEPARCGGHRSAAPPVPGDRVGGFRGRRLRPAEVRRASGRLRQLRHEQLHDVPPRDEPRGDGHARRVAGAAQRQRPQVRRRWSVSIWRVRAC
jgi:hypothetical protein